jgi:hypothetical protein
VIPVCKGVTAYEWMTGQVASHLTAQDAGAFAVDNPHTVVALLESGVQEFVQTRKGFVHRQPVKVYLLARRTHG